MDWTSRVRHAFGQGQQIPDEDVVLELGQHAAALYEQARADGHDAARAAELVDAQIALWMHDRLALERRARHAPALVAPAHATIVNAAFTPTDAEVAEAERLVTAFAEARRAGRDRAHVDDHLVEMPTWRNAEALLARAAALRGRLKQRT